MRRKVVQTPKESMLILPLPHNGHIYKLLLHKRFAEIEKEVNFVKRVLVLYTAHLQQRPLLLLASFLGERIEYAKS